jgi:hypothetical protein
MLISPIACMEVVSKRRVCYNIANYDEKESMGRCRYHERRRKRKSMEEEKSGRKKRTRKKRKRNKKK